MRQRIQLAIGKFFRSSFTIAPLVILGLAVIAVAPRARADFLNPTCKDLFETVREDRPLDITNETYMSLRHLLVRAAENAGQAASADRRDGPAEVFEYSVSSPAGSAQVTDLRNPLNDPSGRSDNDLRQKSDAYSSLSWALKGHRILEISNNSQVWLNFISHGIETGDLMHVLEQIGAYKVRIHMSFPELSPVPAVVEIVPNLVRDFTNPANDSLQLWFQRKGHREMVKLPIYQRQIAGLIDQVSGTEAASRKLEAIIGFPLKTIVRHSVSQDFYEQLLTRAGYVFVAGQVESGYYELQAPAMNAAISAKLIAALQKMGELEWVFVDPRTQANSRSFLHRGVIHQEDFRRTWAHATDVQVAPAGSAEIGQVDGYPVLSPLAQIVRELEAKGYVYNPWLKTWDKP